MKSWKLNELLASHRIVDRHSILLRFIIIIHTYHTDYYGGETVHIKIINMFYDDYENDGGRYTLYAFVLNIYVW